LSTTVPPADLDHRLRRHARAIWQSLEAVAPAGRFRNDEGGSVEQHSDRRLHLHHCLNYAALLAVLDGVGDRLDLLEVGCGSGALSHALAQAMPSGWRLTATDYSQALIDSAATRFVHPRLRFHRLDLLVEEPAILASCGVVLLLEVIEHFSREQAAMLLAKLHAALPPGGRLVLSTLDRSAFRRRFSGYPPHRFEYDRRSMTELLADPARNPFRRWRLLRLTSPRITGESVRAEDRGGHLVNRLSGFAHRLARRYRLLDLALRGLLTVGSRFLRLAARRRFDLDGYLETAGLREDPDGAFDPVAFGLVVELVRD
jgi:SAM-dependent methyltransferase